MEPQVVVERFRRALTPARLAELTLPLLSLAALSVVFGLASLPWHEPASVPSPAAPAPKAPGSFDTVEELLTPEGVRAAMRERFGEEAEITVHEIAPVEREGERPNLRVHGEAVVEIAFDKHRILTMIVLMQYGQSKPIRWQDGILSPCWFEPREVKVTNQPTAEELAWFRGFCRTVRLTTMSGAADEPVPFRYGYVNPERTWPKKLPELSP